MEAQVRPAPKPTNKMLSPFFKAPAACASQRAIGIEAAEVLAYLSTLTQSFSMGIFKRFAAEEMMRIFAWWGTNKSRSSAFMLAAFKARFAAVPIIGWAVALIGTSIAAITITKNRRKNEETIRKVQETVRQLSTMTKKQTKEMNRASQIINTLIAKRAYLNHSFFTSYPMDCMAFSTDQKEYLLDCCHIYIELCHNINVSIAK